MITINIYVIYIILAIVLGIVGWVFAFHNHSSISKYKKEFDEATLKLIEAQEKDKMKIETSWEGKYEDIVEHLNEKVSEHSREISEMLHQNELNIKALEQEHEVNLTELSELADNKLKELQEGLQAEVETYEKYIQNIGILIKMSRDVINQVDAREVYRTDDELEVFFNALKSIQEELDKFQVEISDEQT